MRARKAIASLLVLLASLAYGVARWIDPSSAPAQRSEARPADPPRLPAPPPQAPAAERSANPAVGKLHDAELEAQVGRVIAAVDATGKPPAGVAQGGRRGGPKGLFDNADGRLPRKPRGYYMESDVWPRGPGGRGAIRLVFGKEGEVYFTADHYRSFTRLR